MNLVTTWFVILALYALPAGVRTVPTGVWLSAVRTLRLMVGQ